MDTNEPADQPDTAPDSPTDASATTSSATDSDAASAASRAQPLTAMPSTGPLRVLSIIVIAAGAIFVIAGVVTWFIVRDQLADEQIVVSDDAPFLGGDDVDGPFSAYAEAEAINDHAREASGGLTYAELERDDPTRETVMTASFLTGVTLHLRGELRRCVFRVRRRHHPRPRRLGAASHRRCASGGPRRGTRPVVSASGLRGGRSWGSGAGDPPDAHRSGAIGAYHAADGPEAGARRPELARGCPAPSRQP